MKYAVIVTYTTGERTGATVTASGCAAAWDKVFEMFDKADVRGVELAAILTPFFRKGVVLAQEAACKSNLRNWGMSLFDASGPIKSQVARLAMGTA